MKIKLLSLGVIFSILAVTGIIYSVYSKDQFKLKISSEPQNSSEQTKQQNAVEVYQKANQAVVSIVAGKKSGSGTIISADGLILTNAHVVRNVSSVEVTLANGQKITGKVIGFGANGLDLAMIQIPQKNQLSVITRAKINTVKVGQSIFAIGNPFGQFAGSLTTGIISRIDSEKGLIQTDAAINPGYSGGPLLNEQGELIGINTAIFAQKSSADPANIGISFAISVEQVEKFITEVREGKASRTAQIPQVSNPSKHQQALLTFEREIQANPNNYKAWNGKGVALGNLGRHQEALVAFEKALTINPSFVLAWNGKGTALGSLGRHQEALVAFEEALKIDPNFAPAWNGKGISLGNLGRHQEALVAFEEALKIDPNFTAAQKNRETALRRLKQ